MNHDELQAEEKDPATSLKDAAYTISLSQSREREGKEEGDQGGGQRGTIGKETMLR